MDTESIIGSWKQRWIESVAPDEPQKLRTRLSWDDLTESEFEKRMKSEPSIVAGNAYDWTRFVDEIRAALTASWDSPLISRHPGEQRAFVDLWWPVRSQALARLEDACADPTNDCADIAEPVFEQLSDALISRLCTIGEQSIWERFNIGRHSGKVLLARIAAEEDAAKSPPNMHYEAFIKRNRKDGLQAIFDEFPVLASVVGTAYALWFQNSVTLLQRVRADRNVLEAKFSVPVMDPISAITTGLSDAHRGGQSVALLTFGEPLGKKRRVVYKPKNLAVDAAYQALMKDLNANCDLPPLRTLTIHTGDGYGYMEHVLHQICADDRELDAFYSNAGRLTAILHMLGCTDCHHENLIAHGDQLLLIDTETLLEADLRDHVAEASSQPEIISLTDLQKRFGNSVLRTGLLPQMMVLGDASEPVDISALGISPPKFDVFRDKGWLDINSDRMVPGSIERPAVTPTSLPVGVGETNPLDRFLVAFTTGFKAQSLQLMEQLKRLSAPDGPLSTFAGLPRRIVLRATRVYWTIQRQLIEPTALRSWLSQNLRLEQLARGFLLAETKPKHWPVFASEIDQMRALDIPFFTHLIDSDALDIDTKTGDLIGFIEKSGLQAAYDRLSSLDEKEIEFELQLIRGALEARQLTPKKKVAVEDNPSSSCVAPVREESVKAALQIVDHLTTQAIEDRNGQFEWLGIEVLSDGGRYSFGPVGSSLYSGSIGIACLLGCLNQARIQVANADLIYASILNPLRDLMGQRSGDGPRRWWRDSPLGLDGCGGVLLALHHLGETQLADDMLDALLPRYIEADMRLDLMGGCAGLIGPLLLLKSERALAFAEMAGDHLLARQTDCGAWQRPHTGETLLGLSHGVAGFVAALTRLHQLTQEPRFLSGAAKALSFERLNFNSEHNNWPDYRASKKTNDGPSFMSSWCHGAPGIALARACLWDTELWDQECEKEISTALQTTLALGSLPADHLCCGNLGLMAILRTMSSGPWTLDPELRKECVDAVHEHHARVLHRCTKGPFHLRCHGKFGNSILLPGFFTGLSGMGMALLDTPHSQSLLSQIMTAGLYPQTT